MLHVDEGQLHALLDGAFNETEAQALHDHISACAQCAAQLEEARALRTRSAALLSTAQPARLGTPPFESVLAQANKSAPRRRIWFAQYPLAQAALLVLALGVGWLSRGLTMNAELADRAVPREESASNQTAPAPAAAPLVAPPSPSANEPVGNARSTPEQEQRNAQAFSSAAPLADRAADASAKLSQSKDERAAARKVVSAPAEAGLQSGQRQAQAPPPVQQQAQQQNVARDVQMSARVQATAPAAAGASVAAEGIAPLRWQYMSVERAEQITGRPVLRVPDLDIVNVGVASTSTGFVVLLNQRLADGAILELQQRAEVLAQRERAENEAVELLKERVAADVTASNTASLQRAGLVITARGFVSADSLRALLQRMR